MMHDIERERVRQHVKLIPYPSKPLASQTRQSQQIDPLHFVAPIVDEPLVEQQHVLRELHHHVPSIHSRQSFLRLLQVVREALHPRVVSRQSVPVVVDIKLPSIL